jgi:predicted nucleic acid-binding Zn ribbon protein
LWIQLRKILTAKNRLFGAKHPLGFYALQQEWNNLIVDIYGEKFRGKSKPTRIKGGTLFIECASSIWANELRLKGKLLLQLVTKKFKDVPVKKLNFHG